jgi:hypothetical protein
MLLLGDDSFSFLKLGHGNVTARHIPPVADVYHDMHKSIGGIASSWSFGFLPYRKERIISVVCTAKKLG